MAFKLSKRSLSRLEGVHPELVNVVKAAIKITPHDFGVTCGVRDKTTQARLVAEKKSFTMNSKHLIQESTGFSHAVDLVVYYNGDVCWEIDMYDEVADAMKQAAINLGKKIGIKWGGAWTITDICEWNDNMEAAYISYCNTRSQQGRKILCDMPHYEVSRF